MIKFLRFSFRYSSQKSQETLYQILRVSPTSTQEQIASAYNELIQQYNSTQSLKTQIDVEQQNKINEAYQILSNIEKRKIYDQNNGLNGNQDNSKQANVENNARERPNDSLFIQIFIAVMVGGLAQVGSAYLELHKKEEEELKSKEKL